MRDYADRPGQGRMSETLAAEQAAGSPQPIGRPGARYRILHLSRNYPNSVLPRLGLWTERLVHSSMGSSEVKVIAPVPYFPPLPGFLRYARFRQIERRCWTANVEVFHPRFLVGPGYWLRGSESLTYYLGVRGLVAGLRRAYPFDLIHAHFTYPDGVVAVRLGKKYGVPVVITEHAPWGPWMHSSPLALRKAIQAARQSTFTVAVSRAARNSIAGYTGEMEKLRVIPNGVDGSIFTLPENGRRPVENQILFVGIMRQVKGVDILLKAMRLLLDRGREVNLSLVGESFYQTYRRDHKLLRQMVEELRLESKVQFQGPKSPPEVAQAMQESALLVLPSRAESFGAVLAEALACGTPVVATRCGGPEDIVNDQVGVLVPPEDPAALARGIEHVLDRRADYHPERLRDYSLNSFSFETVGRRLADLYAEALERSATH